ncbi:MAG: adenylate/guanylate cyclase domain-containing protein [Lentisphaerae bacterium]|nr:adenylate/guanylate cyclase domain-containing protein [Lentisphaerota bacterium]
MTRRSIKALLFSDVKSFSKLSEKECINFCRIFHSGIQSDVLAAYDDRIVLKNTWGDALHVVMDDVVTAGKLALDLRDWMAGFNWQNAGISSTPEIRIGLHAGVVSHVADPITGKFNYIGRNTSKAARIEPITFEGQVFVSQAFAALLSAQGSDELTCEYVGVRELPKNSGSISVYLLQRKSARDRYR